MHTIVHDAMAVQTERQDSNVKTVTGIMSLSLLLTKEGQDLLKSCSIELQPHTTVQGKNLGKALHRVGHCKQLVDASCAADQVLCCSSQTVLQMMHSLMLSMHMLTHWMQPSTGNVDTMDRDVSDLQALAAYHTMGLHHVCL